MTTYSLTRDELEHEVDIAIAGSFPASDPPPWTLGAVPPVRESTPGPPAAVAPAAIDVVIAAGRGGRRALSVVEALVMTALVPVGVVLAAAPVLLMLWGIAWLLGIR